MIITGFMGILGDLTEDASESLAHLGTPRPKKGLISDDTLRKKWGEMDGYPIPREVSMNLSRRACQCYCVGCGRPRARVSQARRRRSC